MPIILQVLSLLNLELKSFLHALWHDLAKEITAVVCGIVVFLLFFYMFNDFLNEKVGEISSALHMRFGDVLSWAWIATGFFILGRLLRAPAVIADFASSIGENRLVCKTFLVFRVIVVLCISLAFLLWINTAVLNRSLTEEGFLRMVFLAPLLFAGYFSKDQRVTKWKPLLTAASKSPSRALFLWRWNHLTRRGRMERLCLLIACLFASGQVLLSGAPEIAKYLAAFVSGLFISYSLLAQAQSDINWLWAEKSFGISHEQWQKAHEKASWSAGTLGGLFCAGMYAVTETFNNRQIDLNSIAIIYLSVFTPSVLASWLIFQIDPKKPLVTMVCTLLLGIFLLTAIYAHLIATILIPIVRAYLISYQKDALYKVE